jgi:hypothetical protein
VRLIQARRNRHAGRIEHQHAHRLAVVVELSLQAVSGFHGVIGAPGAEHVSDVGLAAGERFNYADCETHISTSRIEASRARNHKLAAGFRSRLRSNDACRSAGLFGSADEGGALREAGTQTLRPDFLPPSACRLDARSSE